MYSRELNLIETEKACDFIIEGRIEYKYVDYFPGLMTKIMGIHFLFDLSSMKILYQKEGISLASLGLSISGFWGFSVADDVLEINDHVIAYLQIFKNDNGLFVLTPIFGSIHSLINVADKNSFYEKMRAQRIGKTFKPIPQIWFIAGSLLVPTPFDSYVVDAQTALNVWNKTANIKGRLSAGTLNPSYAHYGISLAALPDGVLGQAQILPRPIGYRSAPLILNSKIAWSPPSLTPSAGQYDMLSVLIHEMGHAMGLGHSDQLSSNMYPSFSAGTTKRVLQSDEVTAIRSLYP